MTLILLVVCAGRAGSANLRAEKRPTKNAHSVLREDERASSSDMPLRLRCRSPGNPHAAFRGTTSNTPGRCRSGALISPTGASNSRAESGHRYNGLSRTDLLARVVGFLQSLFALGDLPRTGAGGTFSRVRHLTRSRSLCGAVCAYSSQRSGQHRLTVADTIANDTRACQAIFWNADAERFT
jgi:hypothetical protein